MSLGDDALRRLLDDERHADAVAARRRGQSLRGQAAESGTLAGTLIDLGERRAVVSLVTTGGRSLRGTIVSLGADLVVLRGPSNETVLVALGAVASVRTEPGTIRSIGDRLLRSEATLAEVVGELAVDRPHVAIHTGAAAVSGELRAVGLDVATLVQTDQTVAYVALGAVSDVVVS